MKLLLLSSVNLTANPRVYKELQLAYSLNYEITFVGFKIGNWSDAGDEMITKQFPNARFIYLDATRRNYFNWLYYTLLQIACKFLWPLNKRSLWLASVAHSKRTIQLQKLFKRFERSNYDLILGHTLPTLYPALQLAKRINSKVAFDVEDYHPGEEVSTDIKNEVRRKEILLERILPLCDYVTASSSLISDHIGALTGQHPVTVLNSFPRSEFLKPVLVTGNKMKLVWFSQNISSNRGLELILSRWKELQPYFEITLIGNLYTEFYDAWIKDHKDIVIRKPMSQIELHHDLRNYDIGLALEPGKDVNNKLALSNKIHAYLQAGLYILATDTPAQSDFIRRYPSHGMAVEADINAMYNALIKLFSIKEKIRSENIERFLNASQHCWETEASIIKNEWEKINNKR